MNERLKTHSKTQKKSADLVSNKLRIGVFQRYQMKCKSVSKKSPRYIRKNLTILAGFYDVVTTIRGEVRYRAKSLSYANMDQDEFERCYNAMINAALKHVFGRSNNPELNNRLLSFF
ncbi:DUF1367 family protein [Escherichia coli]|uniref:DUF1367 family protein n=1 Tax=Escherichia coli TaxID=562 RepID=UPI000D132184|nr:DUF1367 family protein [Escherichia coli]EED0778305.1 DUF1367 family protein [Escherichia coli]EEX1701943.1 DUF1367 family protein [Escherichia coli]EFE3905513.1 DUF1367 family protein [Escherichia coli]EFE6612022.1 DUF1367 family protein [Escherichia coli]EFG5503469.1 DUF1367 family protein [Escherichia coli]